MAGKGLGGDGAASMQAAFPLRPSWGTEGHFGSSHPRACAHHRRVEMRSEHPWMRCRVSPNLPGDDEAEQEFGFRASTDVPTGLRRTVDWYREQQLPEGSRE